MREKRGKIGPEEEESKHKQTRGHGEEPQYDRGEDPGELVRYELTQDEERRDQANKPEQNSIALAYVAVQSVDEFSFTHTSTLPPSNGSAISGVEKRRRLG